MIRKERQSRSYRLSAYFLAKTLSEMPILCVLPLINITIIYFMVGFPYEYVSAHPSRTLRTTAPFKAGICVSQPAHLIVCAPDARVHTALGSSSSTCSPSS